jgi:hypothetical protein
MRLALSKISLAVVVWAAVVAGFATFFGFQFAPEAHHEEAATADAEAGGEEEASHEEEEAEEEAGHEEGEAEPADEDASGGQVATAVLISVGGALLVPLTVLPARRRVLAESVQTETETETEVDAELGLEKVLLLGTALLSTGAAIIHFAVIAQHFDEWWLAGIFFTAVALFQVAWVVAVVLRPSARVFLAGAVINALVVLTWIVSRTTGIPVGPEAGEAEAVDLPDSLATAYEVLIVAAAWALAARISALRRPLRSRTAAIVTWVVAAAVAVLTALALVSLP